MENETPKCGYLIWPYTENNICVLGKGHEGDHVDARDRPFTNSGYTSKRVGES